MSVYVKDFKFYWIILNANFIACWVLNYFIVWVSYIIYNDSLGQESKIFFYKMSEYFQLCWVKLFLQLSNCDSGRKSNYQAMHKQNDMTRFGHWATLLIPALGFSRYTILSANRVFLFSNCYASTDCSFLIALPNISSKMLNSSGVTGYLCLVPNGSENTLSVSHYDDVKISINSYLLSVFTKCWFLKVISASIYDLSLCIQYGIY